MNIPVVSPQDEVEASARYVSQYSKNSANAAASSLSGTVVVTDHAVHVRLAPAANKAELAAIAEFFEQLNQRELILPSDHQCLPLRFDLARAKV